MNETKNDRLRGIAKNALQSVSVEQARDLLNSLIEVVEISSSINKKE